MTSLDNVTNDAVFVVQYISSIAEQDKSPLEEAKNEIAEIDLKLNEAEKLKLRRLRLSKVLDNLGDSSLKKVNNSNNCAMSGDVSFDSEECTSLKIKIQNFVSVNNGTTIRNIINAVGSYDQDALIIRLVKKLGEDGILSRDDNEKIICGDNF